MIPTNIHIKVAIFMFRLILYLYAMFCISHSMSFGVIVSGVVELAIQSIKGWFLQYASCPCVKDAFKMEDKLISAKTVTSKSVFHLAVLYILQQSLFFGFARFFSATLWVSGEECFLDFVVLRRPGLKVIDVVFPTSKNLKKNKCLIK